MEFGSPLIVKDAQMLTFGGAGCEDAGSEVGRRVLHCTAIQQRMRFSGGGLVWELREVRGLEKWDWTPTERHKGLIIWLVEKGA